MDWSEQTLKYVYESYQPPYTPHRVGDFWPYNGRASEADMQFLRFLYELKSDLERSDLVAVGENFGDFQGGFASFGSFYCFKKDGSSTRHFGSAKVIMGIVINVSCLAPVAVYGSGDYFLKLEMLGVLPPGDWERVWDEVHPKFERRGLEFASPEVLGQFLPFDANLHTLMGDPPFRVYDLLFSWDD